MLEFHPFLREGWLTPVLAEMAAAFTRPHCCFFSFPLCSLWISGTWVGNWSDRGTRSEVAAVLGFHLLEFHHPLPRPPLYCLQQMKTPAGMWWLSFSAPGCSGQGWNLWLNQALAVRTLFSVRPVAWMWTCPGAWTTSAMVEVCGISTLLSRISSWTGKIATSRPFSPTEQFAFLGWFLLVLRTHLPGCPSSWWNHSLILHNVCCFLSLPCYVLLVCTTGQCPREATQATASCRMPMEPGLRWAVLRVSLGGCQETVMLVDRSCGSSLEDVRTVDCCPLQTAA